VPRQLLKPRLVMGDVGAETTSQTSTSPGLPQETVLERAFCGSPTKTPILVREPASICLRGPSIENGGLGSGSGEPGACGRVRSSGLAAIRGCPSIVGRGISEGYEGCKKRGGYVQWVGQAEGLGLGVGERHTEPESPEVSGWRSEVGTYWRRKAGGNVVLFRIPDCQLRGGDRSCLAALRSPLVRPAAKRIGDSHDD
jgi:hypothetical protein